MHTNESELQTEWNDAQNQGNMPALGRTHTSMMWYTKQHSQKFGVKLHMHTREFALKPMWKCARTRVKLHLKKNEIALEAELNIALKLEWKGFEPEWKCPEPEWICGEL